MSISSSVGSRSVVERKILEVESWTKHNLKESQILPINKTLCGVDDCIMQVLLKAALLGVYGSVIHNDNGHRFDSYQSAILLPQVLLL